MSDIAGPPAPKEIQSPIRGADKTTHVAKDPNSDNTRTGGQSQEQATRDQGKALQSRDPAVSIASSAAHLVSGQEITQPVTRIDAEGRPIIVTDTVTLALKPDAGLQPNDTVHLIVVDAGKQVTADLLRQNSQPVDPPIRLSVTVIEVHTTALTSDVPSTGPERKPEAALDRPYNATISAKPPGANQPTAELTALISRQDTVPASPTVLSTPDNAAAAQPDGPKPVVGPAGSTIASSADLATLIQQQTAKVQPAATSHSSAPPVSGPGIGPGLSAISVTGAPAVIQLLDPAISRVSPAELATVKTVQTITAAEARALPVSAAAFGASTAIGELAKADTTRGQFILPAADAASLAGELVRVSVDTKPPQQPGAPAEQKAEASFRALFIENKTGALPAKVDVILTGNPAAGEPNVTGSAVINSVQTVAAFFGADGPKTDLRLQTNRGDISLTVPSGVRPQVGDTLRVIVPGQSDHPTVPKAGQPQTSPVAPSTQPDVPLGTTAVAPASIAQSVSAVPFEGTSNILASWPAMEESLAALLGTNAAAANSLVSKTAQGGNKLTNSLLFFLKAAGMAGNSNWMGSDVEKALSRSSQLALSGLRSDIGQMASLASETIGEWRPILLPFDARGGDVPLAALLLGQRPDIDPDAHQDNPGLRQRDKEDAQRFILQVQFSVLGDIQLDGNILKQSFDLTVRSKTDLPAALQQDASALFYDALSANNFTGTIEFRQQDAFTVDAAALIEGHLRGDSTG